MPRPLPSQTKPIQRFRISDELWEHIERLLPPEPDKPALGGRPRLDRRVVMDAIFVVLRTGCQWQAINRFVNGCCGSAAHGYFQKWVKKGFFKSFWKAGLTEYDEVKGIDWKWQAIDGAITKAPLADARPDQAQPIARNWAPSGRCRLTRWAYR